MHLPHDFPAHFTFRHRNIALALQVEPKSGAVAEVTGMAEPRIGRNGAAAIEDIGNAARRHAEIERQMIGAKLPAVQFAAEQPSGTRVFDSGYIEEQCFQMTTALVIIDVQNAVMNRQLPPERQRLVDAAQTAMVLYLQGVLEQARAAGVPVVFVQHNDPPGEALANGSPGWRIRAEIAPHAGEATVQKLNCDSFHGTDWASTCRLPM